jgi:hypothetical protein
MYGKLKMIIPFPVGGDAAGGGDHLALRVLRDPEPGAASDQTPGQGVQTFYLNRKDFEILGGMFVLIIMVLMSGLKTVKEHTQLVVYRLGIRTMMMSTNMPPRISNISISLLHIQEIP